MATASGKKSALRRSRSSTLSLWPIPIIHTLTHISLFAFLIVHHPFYLSIAVFLYVLIWVAERLYHIIIALARLLLVGFVVFLVLESLSNYIPPQIPAAGRHDALWVGRAEVLMLRSLLSNF